MKGEELSINSNMDVFKKLFNIEKSINNIFSSAQTIKDSVMFFAILTIIYLILIIITGIKISNALENIF